MARTPKHKVQLVSGSDKVIDGRRQRTYNVVAEDGTIYGTVFERWAGTSMNYKVDARDLSGKVGNKTIEGQGSRARTAALVKRTALGI